MKSYSTLKNAMNKSSGRLLGHVLESFKIVMALIVFSVIGEHDSFVKAAIITGMIIIIVVFHSRESIWKAKGGVERVFYEFGRLFKMSLGDTWRWWCRKEGEIILRRKTTRERWKRKYLQRWCTWERHWGLMVEDILWVWSCFLAFVRVVEAQCSQKSPYELRYWTS